MGQIPSGRLRKHATDLNFLSKLVNCDISIIKNFKVHDKREQHYDDNLKSHWCSLAGTF
jgi:hypothetical protein